MIIQGTAMTAYQEAPNIYGAAATAQRVDHLHGQAWTGVDPSSSLCCVSISNDLLRARLGRRLMVWSSIERALATRESA
jgi:hypothetical protein